MEVGYLLGGTRLVMRELCTYYTLHLCMCDHVRTQAGSSSWSKQSCL